MSDFDTAIATFSSSNKAGSIPQFTRYLQKHPDDYLALMWRARAYSLTEQVEEARADVHRAISVSQGADKMVAEAQLQHLLGNSAKYVEILRSTIKEYPKCSSAWSDLGGVYFHTKDYNEAVLLLIEAINVAKENGEVKAPWHSWDNYMLGEVFLEQNENAKASEYFKAAIDSCPTLTVAHLGLCKTNILEKQFTEAKQNFETARNLNPTLVNEENFESFKELVLSNDKQARRTMGSSPKSKESGGAGGTSGKDGSSSSGDEESESAFMEALKKKTKELEEMAPCIRTSTKDRGLKYIQSKCGDYWYSPDFANHGRGGKRSAFKRYRDTKRTMIFDCAVRLNLTPITNKHESKLNPMVEKKDTKIVHGKD